MLRIDFARDSRGRRTRLRATVMKKLLTLVFLLAFESPGESQDAAIPPRGEHVVLCVWDGMRPDFITPEYTPTLHALAESGTFFANNHSFYITTTEVNGTVLATGVFPRRSGVIANREYRPAINLMKPVATEGAHTVRVGDALSGGQYLGVPTVAEIVQRAGSRTAVAGTKPIALLHDRGFDRSGKGGSAVLFGGKTYPESLATMLLPAFGKFPDYPPTAVTPDDSRPNTGQNAWTTRVFTEILWQYGVPRYSVLWLGDPDYSQHQTCPGHPTALAAIKNSDDNLAIVLDALERRGARDRTNIFVVSDHGFSTIDRTVDLVAAFRKAGIAAFREFRMTPKQDDVLVVNVGGSTSLYVVGGSRALVQKLVDTLQTSDFAGPIFTRDGLPGTFTLREGRMDSEHAPDVVFSFRALPGKNQFGVPGLIWGEGKRTGVGTHGTMSRTDIRNTLVAAGPDIRAGFRNELPTGNIDVVPTILHLLGLPAPEPLDGRLLAEALLGGVTSAKPETSRLEASRKIGGKSWRQWIETTALGERVYHDEGNAARE